MIDQKNLPMSEGRLNSLYVADLHYEPLRRRNEIDSSGVVTIETIDAPAALHARVAVPDFGDVWVIADNCGEGYRPGDAVLDFVREAALSHYKKAADIIRGGSFSVQCMAHFDAAEYFLNEGKSHSRSGLYNLKALSHALWAGEMAVVERARGIIEGNSPREGFLFGCNVFSKLDGPPDSELFPKTFNFGTLPFYLSRVEPVPGDLRYYEHIDMLLEWCEKMGVVPKGHPLWWGSRHGRPDWLIGSSWEEIQRQCRRTIERNLQRYSGRIKIWDAINEAHDWNNGLYLTHEQEVEITRVCCDTLRNFDPDSTGVVNICFPFGEYVADGKVSPTTPGPVYDDMFSPLSYFDALMQANVEFDAVGLQIYFPCRDMLSVDLILEEYERFGKPIHITELGVRTTSLGINQVYENCFHGNQVDRSEGEWHFKWCEKVQADWLDWFYTICYAREKIKAITWWSFNDPGFIPSGGVTTEDFIPKESLFRLRQLRKNLFRA